MKDSLISVRNTLPALFCLALLGAGCQMVQPHPNPASLDNASSQTWSVTASFASGPDQTFDQAPGTLHTFGDKDRGSPPALTRIVAVSKSAQPVTYSLSARNLARLRGAAPGALMVVLYDGGIACLSPRIKKAMEQDLSNYPSNPQEYFRLLGIEEDAALMWTRNVLGGK